MHIGMCSPNGYGFSAVLVINRVSILADFGHLAGLEVNFLVHLQSFASKIFFCWQTGEITNKFLPNVW